MTQKIWHFPKSLTQRSPEVFANTRRRIVFDLVNYIIDSKFRKSVYLTNWLREGVSAAMSDKGFKEILADIKVGESDDETIINCLSWVVNNIFYYGDITLWNMLERWQTPLETIYSKKGDCLIWNTKLLLPSKETINLEDIEIGDNIIGKSGNYCKILNKWDKGILPTKIIKLNNGTSITCTDNHKFILDSGEEKLASHLKIGDLLKQTNKLSCNNEEVDEEYWYLKGLYVSDGWADHTKLKVCISGLDGHKKEKQKEWVKHFCEKYDIDYYWNKKYIMIKDRDIYEDFCKCGTHAINKHLERLPQNEYNIKALLKGLAADAYINKHNSITYGTISNKLKTQIRILYRMIGKSVHERLWQPTRTQFGNNPIWRITVRNRREVPIKITEILEGVEERVFDIEVEEKEIYLPENDCLVHNCEDGHVLLYALAIGKGISSDKMFLWCGDVQVSPTAPLGGHCSLLYKPLEYPLNFVWVDWCYNASLQPVFNRRLVFLNDKSIEEFTPSVSKGWMNKTSCYKKSWFLFNEGFSTNSYLLNNKW